MTYVTSSYNFMDLLKDYNYVPEADQPTANFFKDAANLITRFAKMVKRETVDYDFMDLLGDNGYVPVNDNWVKSASNDNGANKIAS